MGINIRLGITKINPYGSEQTKVNIPCKSTNEFSGLFTNLKYGHITTVLHMYVYT